MTATTNKYEQLITVWKERETPVVPSEFQTYEDAIRTVSDVFLYEFKDDQIILRALMRDAYETGHTDPHGNMSMMRGESTYPHHEFMVPLYFKDLSSCRNNETVNAVRNAMSSSDYQCTSDPETKKKFLLLIGLAQTTDWWDHITGQRCGIGPGGTRFTLSTTWTELLLHNLGCNNRNLTKDPNQTNPICEWKVDSIWRTSRLISNDIAEYAERNPSAIKMPRRD